MNLAELRKKAIIASKNILVKRPVTWVHVDDKGEEVEDTFDIYIRRISTAEAAKLGGTENEGKNFTMLMVSECVRLGDKGEEKISYEECHAMDASLINVLFPEVMEVTGLGREPNKKLGKNKASGTN